MAVSETNMTEFTDGCHHQVESEWMSEVFFVANGGNQSWQVWVSLRGNTKMTEFQDGQIQDGRIQDGCHHQVQWEWMSLSQIELVWVRVRVEWECFWVNLREDNKVSESKMAVSETNIDRIQDGCHYQVESEWMREVFFVQMVGTILGKWEWLWEEILRWLNPRWPEFKMAVIIKLGWEWISLSQIEWVWVRVRVEWECFWVNLRKDNQGVWIQDGSVWNQHDSIQDGWHHQVESEWMSEVFLWKWWETILASVSEFERKY